MNGAASGEDVGGDGVGASGKGNKGRECEDGNEAGSWTGGGSCEAVDPDFAIPYK